MHICLRKGICSENSMCVLQVCSSPLSCVQALACVVRRCEMAALMDPCKVFIGQLHFGIAMSRLSSIMLELGIPSPTEIHIVNKDAQKPACAFVTFQSCYGASECIRILHGRVDANLSPTFVKVHSIIDCVVLREELCSDCFERGTVIRRRGHFT